jgi:hypothetical protein
MAWPITDLILDNDFNRAVYCLKFILHYFSENNRNLLIYAPI